jgi:hypothetical protein
MGNAFGAITDDCLDFVLVKTGKYEIRSYGPFFVAEVECNDGQQLKEAFAALCRYIGVDGTPENVKGRKKPVNRTEASAALLDRIFYYLGSPDAPVGQQVSSTSVPITITLPVLREHNVLQMILPREYTDVESIPIPTNANIIIRSVPPRTVAVSVFYGHADRATYQKKIDKLRNQLVADKLIGPPHAEDAPERNDPTLRVASVQSAPSAAAPASAVGEPAGSIGPPASTTTTAGPPEVHWSVARYHPHFTLPAFRRNEVWIDLDVAYPTVAALLQEHQFQRNKQAAEKSRDEGGAGVAAAAGPEVKKDVIPEKQG